MKAERVGNCKVLMYKIEIFISEIVQCRSIPGKNKGKVKVQGQACSGGTHGQQLTMNAYRKVPVRL